MPDISRDEVSHLADLARIDLSAEELDHLAPQLSVILEAIASISECTTSCCKVPRWIPLPGRCRSRCCA